MNQLEMIATYMQRRLNALSHDPNEGRVRSQLANLRRGIGKMPGDLPELWGTLFADMPENMMSQNGEPTRAEWAVYIALTLYALHQQSKNIRVKNMHCTENKGRLGLAVGSLVKVPEDRDRIARRFNAFATANDIQEAAHYLRGVIDLLRANDIPLDYVRLACELYRFQDPDAAPNVRLKWGQDFYHMKLNEDPH